MRAWLSVSLVLVTALAHAQGVLSVTLGQKGGWMADGWGTLEFRLDGAEPHARLVKFQAHWVIVGKQRDAVSATWEGDGKSRSWVGSLPASYVKDAAPRAPKLVGTVTIFESGNERDEPFSIDVPGAKLPSPLEIHKGKHVGIALQATRWAAGEAPDTILPLFDTAYERMHDLTGVYPDGGKTIIWQESPPNPYYAYAGNPIILNGDYVARALSEMKLGHLPFGWIHELGHDFDVNGDWYIWNGACAEFQANFKLGYVVETPIKGWRMVWDGYGSAAYPVPGGKTDSDGYRFEDSFFLFFGDKYLADPTRKWDSMTSDETHSFFLRLVRIYGWDPIKRWYRDYDALAAKGLKPPSTPEEKISLCCGLLSKETGVDLIPIFQRWRYPVDAESVKKAMGSWGLGIRD